MGTISRRVATTAMTTTLLLAVLSACSGGGDDKNKSGDDTKSTTSSAAGKSSTPAFVDVVECEPAGGTGTSSGTIENQGTEATAYELTIGFYDDTSGKRLATGSVTTGTAAPGATVAWSISAPGVGSIASDDLTCTTVTIKATTATGAPTTAAPAQGDAEFPCDIVPAATIAQITGNPLDGDAITSPTSENSLSWTARTCVWTGVGTTTAQEVTLAVSRPADFAAGSPTCPPAPAGATPVAGLGTSATWAWTDPGTEQKVGDLRVCAPAGFVAVRVSGPAGEAAQQAVAKGVAQAALAKL